ncbi:hypothetical protein D3C71_2053990 [compost metagenome]
MDRKAPLLRLKSDIYRATIIGFRYIFNESTGKFPATAQLRFNDRTALLNGLEIVAFYS